MDHEAILPVEAQVAAIYVLIDKHNMSLCQIEEQYPSLSLGICMMRHSILDYQPA